MSEQAANPFVNDTDAGYITSNPDPAQRAIMTESVMRHRRADRLGPGDSLPALGLTRLKDGARVRLDELSGTKPLVLIFGSYT